MSIANLREKIEATIIKWTPEMKRDLKAAISLAQIGGEQTAFTYWLIDEIKNKGKEGWWNPMCLFRRYKLRGKDPGTEKANRIRGEIRAAVEAVPPCPFKPGAWNKKYNNEIYQDWLHENEVNVTEAMIINASSHIKSITGISNSSERGVCYTPTLNDFETAYKQLQNSPREGNINAILEQITKNLYDKNLKHGWQEEILNEIRKKNIGGIDN